VLEFDTPESGLACPYCRSNQGFVPGGFTAGGAPEYVIPNAQLSDLENLTIRRIP
jgi:hypothetical protein